MKGIIEVNGLKVYAYHGALAQERELGNRFEVTLRLVYPVDESAWREDRLEGTLNYAQAVEVARRTMATPSSLLEHVAWRMRRDLLEAFPKISGGTIRIAKLTPPIPGQMDSVAVTLNIETTEHRQ